MELTFELRQEDLDAFYRHGNASAWGMLLFECLLVVAGLVALDWFFFRNWPITGAVVNVVGISLYALGKWRKRHELHDRNVHKIVSSRDGLIGCHRLKMSSEGYEHSVGPARVVWRWEQVKGVMETEQHVFVRVGVAGATIIPKRAFSDPTDLKWLRNKLQAAGRT